MLAKLIQIRPGEGRRAVGAFVLLFGVLAGHTLLETARDALFLEHLPAEHLPWVYLLIAVTALAVARLQTQGRRHLTARWSLAAWLVGSAGVTFLFWSFGVQSKSGALYALYIWSGLFASVSLVQFWLVLGNLYTATQAKRLYGFIGAGSVLGALAGAGLARWVAGELGTEPLLVFASGAMFVSGVLVPFVLGETVGSEDRAGRRRPALAGLVAGLRVVRRHPYLRRVAALVVLSTGVFTLVDYVFKSEVAAGVDASELGTFFASFYLSLNAVALAVQLGLVGWLLRVLGVHRALIVLPVLLGVGSGGVALGGGLAAVLFLKGADGGLRHSLYRTSVELLYVPVADRMRERAKTAIDVLGHRGGQALSSLVILAGVALGVRAPLLALGVVLLAVVWVLLSLDMRSYYLDLFRASLREGSIETRVELRSLDLSALETLFQALNSTDDDEVLGALDLLTQQDRINLVPALILYHPSRAVVLTALEAFVAANRRDLLPLSKRLLEHPDPEVRAAVLGARAQLAPNERELRAALDDAVPLVRATALVALTSEGWAAGDEGQQILARLRQGANVAEALAVARAIRSQPSPRFVDLLQALSETAVDLEVRAEVARAMGEIADPDFVGALIPMLAVRELREAARDALVRIGDAALRALHLALHDQGRDAHVRRHIPRTISRFASEEAAEILLNHLLHERDSVVRYKILRGLGRIRADHPEVEMHGNLLREALRTTMEAAFRLLDARVSLASEVGEPIEGTAHELLVALLLDKERQLIERVFRVLGLCFPEEDVEQIYRGLFGGDLKVQSSAHELLDHLLEPPLRGPLLALVDDLPEEQKLVAARPVYKREKLGHEALIARLLASESEAIRALVASYVGERRLGALRPQLEALREQSGFLGEAAERALELFEQPSAAGLAGAS